MTLICSLCPQVITSLLVGDNEKALREVSEAFIMHLIDKHKTEHKQVVSKLTSITGILPWLLCIQFAKFKDENYVNSEFEKWRVKVLTDLGLCEEI